MVQAATSVKYQIADTEIDALITESALIKLHQPKYNLITKDDKSFIYIVITKDNYPRVLLSRTNKISLFEKSYRSLFGPYLSLATAKIIYRYARQAFPFCASPASPKSKKVCFDYHLGLCPGACIGLVNQQFYLKQIQSLELLLKGKRRFLIRSLSQAINQASQAEDFETAAKLERSFQFLSQTSNSSPKKLDLSLPQILPDIENEAIVRLSKKLRPFFHLPPNYILSRLEAYDISHLGGHDAVASMVVITNGHLLPSAYRRFKIKTIVGINDPASLRETLKRRFQHQEWPFPDLILIDGGKSQLNFCTPVIPPSVIVMGLTKKPDRVIFKAADGLWHRYPLTPPELADGILIRLRNEAHRFANNYRKLLYSHRFALT